VGKILNKNLVYCDGPATKRTLQAATSWGQSSIAQNKENARDLCNLMQK
jgi:hypothetical protein